MVSFSVANINPGTVRAEFMASIMRLVDHEHQTGGEFIRPEDEEFGWIKSGQHFDRIHFGQYFSKLAGPYLDTERNMCVEWFTNSCTSDYLLFIDSDVGFDAHEPYELVRIAQREGIDLIGGVYHNAISGGIYPLAYHWRHDDALDQRNLMPVTCEALETMGTLTDHAAVDAMGTGFMLISRTLLAAMAEAYNPPTRWFAELDIDGIQMGEDFTFCVRAAAIGFQPYIAPRIIVDHYKVCCLRKQPTGEAITITSPPVHPALQSLEKV